MDLQLGQKVVAIDGDAGDLVNVVVDPTTMRVTHIVVDPKFGHRLERLVPISAVQDQSAGALNVLHLDMTRQDFKRLEAVSYRELVDLGSDVEARGDWSVGNQEVWGLPYWGAKLQFSSAVDHVAVTYHRIPKGDCEIRRSSEVLASDGVSVGSVAGLSADGDEITGVIVRSDRHRTLVPMQSIVSVANDVIELAETADQFAAMPSIKATTAFSRFFSRPPARPGAPFPPIQTPA